MMLKSSCAHDMPPGIYRAESASAKAIARHEKCTLEAYHVRRRVPFSPYASAIIISTSYASRPFPAASISPLAAIVKTSILPKQAA